MPWYGQPISQCELLLNRAKQGGSKSVNIVPTQYWVDERSRKYQSGVCHPDNWAENQKARGAGQRVQGFGFRVGCRVRSPKP